MNFEVIDFELFIVGFVSCYLVQPTLLLMYVASKKLLFIKPNFKFLSKKLVRRLGSYGFYVMLGGMSHLVVNNIDILMLGSISGLTDTAIYTIAFYI
jgi:O-antigen/teichoic acid export membrane protein